MHDYAAATERAALETGCACADVFNNGRRWRSARSRKICSAITSITRMISGTGFSAFSVNSGFDLT
jgi:hypothetical protein